jgi:uncharacterized small protein (DUF1192 family)
MVNYIGLIALLIEAVTELDARIAVLENACEMRDRQAQGRRSGVHVARG